MTLLGFALFDDPSSDSLFFRYCCLVAVVQLLMLPRWTRAELLTRLGMASRVELVVNEQQTVHVGQRQVNLSQVVKQKCPHLAGDRAYFAPVPWLINGHAHTCYCVVGSFDKVDIITYERHTIQVPDGGTLALDFTTPAPRSLSNDRRPILVTLHGLTGGSHESYVRNVLGEMTKPEPKGGLGWHGVVVNFRGCAGVELTSQRLYHAGQTDDLRHALLYILHHFPRNPIYAIGFSLGANSLAKYLGEEGDRTPVKAACVLGNPWDLHQGHLKLESSIMGRIYSRAMASNLQKMLKRHVPVFKDCDQVDMNDAFLNKNQSLYEFDTIITRRVGGFKSTEDYYKSQSSTKTLDGVKVPLLCFNSQDDGIASNSLVPRQMSGRNPNLIFATTKHGGHLGWFEGFVKPKRWIQKPVREWFHTLHSIDPVPKPHPGLVTQSSPPQRFPLKQLKRCEVGSDNFVVDAEYKHIGFKLIKIGTVEGGSSQVFPKDNGMLKGL